ncbi:MAG: hypothetical protein GWP07_06045 [Xanthomonadaceae bacterium]|nr:hypothetical protein [Xanthomonadaceae bacterium]
MVEIERRQRSTSRWQPGKVAWLAVILCLAMVTTGWGMELGNADLSLRSTTRYRVVLRKERSALPNSIPQPVFATTRQRIATNQATVPGCQRLVLR